MKSQNLPSIVLVVQKLLTILPLVIFFCEWTADAKSLISNPGVPDIEKITYGVEDNGNLRTWTDTVRKVNKNNTTVYEWGDKIILRGDDFRPISVHIADEQGRTQIAIDYTDQKAHVVIPIEKIDKWIEVPNDAYDMLTLFYALRGFPYEQKKIKFSLVIPKPRVVKVSLELIGKENVTVRAGTFLCYKLQMKLAGILGRFYRKNWYFWFTVENSHHFVKYEPPTGEVIELVSYEVIE
jgi:hypothetical protein